MILMIKAKGGLTKRLAEYYDKWRSLPCPNASTPSSSLVAFLDGPYGRAPVWEEYESIVMVSTSTGISFMVSILHYLEHLCATKKTRLRTRQVRLTWANKHIEPHFEATVTDLLSKYSKFLRDSGINVEVEFYITCPESKERPTGPDMHNVDLFAHLRSWKPRRLAGRPPLRIKNPNSSDPSESDEEMEYSPNTLSPTISEVIVVLICIQETENPEVLKMATPTLGCQIAPHYEHDYDSDDSSESSLEEDTISGSGEQEQREEAEQADLEKLETQQEIGAIRTATRPSMRTRTRSNRKDPPEPSVGFFHWKMAGVRLHVLKLWFRTNLILSVAIFAFLCLFWGALFNQEKRIGSLGVWVVDFDGQGYDNIEPFVGPFVTQSVRSVIDASNHHLGYTFRSPADFGHDPLKVRESVYDFQAWGAIVINANATALLEAAVRDRNSSYDPLGSCQLIINSARDQSTTSSYIIPAFTAIQKVAVSNFGRQWIPRLLANASTDNSDLGAVPQAVSPGIEFTIYDLRPFAPPIATPAVSIGLIYLIILSFFSFTFFLPIHLKYLSPRGHPPLHFTHLIAWRYVATVVSYFILSCVYSLVSLTFLMPMSNSNGSHAWPSSNPNAYGSGTFVVYWMVNWLGMTALGLASENMAMLLGTPYTALWLIFWVISNVSTGFYPISLESRFYRWGYAWPIHNVAELTRQILFDLHPRIGLNLGILIVWVKKKAAERDAVWQQQMEKEREDPSLLARITTSQRKPA
ncbi:hypothetical protein N0V90_003337 [Kalmusia sp. IMI 367209]|nr:hypothetical protein N0V90_003337 [Kalmusia sp. IMI 367209]